MRHREQKIVSFFVWTSLIKAHIWALCVYVYACVHEDKRDGVQPLPLFPSLNGLLMQSNERVYTQQMCPLWDCFTPDSKTDPSKMSSLPLPPNELCMLCTYFNLFTNFASCLWGGKSKHHSDWAPRVTCNDKSPDSVSLAKNLLEGHLLHWSVKLF